MLWEIAKLTEAKRGFLPPPRRWMIERHFVWAIPFRHLVMDGECYAGTPSNLLFVAFACLMPERAARFATVRRPSLLLRDIASRCV